MDLSHRLAAEYHERNTIPFQDLRPFTKVPVWWTCARGGPAHDWEAPPGNRVTNGAGCPYCAGKRVTPAESLAALRPELAGEWHERNAVRPEDVGTGSCRKVWWRCSKGHEWQAVVKTRLVHGCSQCSGRKASPENNLAVLRPDLAAEWGPDNALAASDVTLGSGRKVWWRCSSEHDWEATVAGRVSRQSGCVRCLGRIATPERNLAVLHPDLAAEWHEKNDLRPEDVTPGSNRRVWWRCSKGHEWRATVHDRTGGVGCRACVRQDPRAQQDLATVLEGLGQAVEVNVRGLFFPGLSKKHEVDLWLPDRRLAVEYCGMYWHGEQLRPDKMEHRDKQLAAAANGIRLVTIFEAEWLSRPQAVRGYLGAILGRAEHVLGARKATLEPAPWKEVSAFLDEHHVQGTTAAGQFVRVLRYEDQVVAAMVCRNAFQRLEKTETRERRWELVRRYCVRAGWRVSGGFARLWKAFLDEHAPPEVWSFSDRRWSVGDLYRRAGFVLDGTTRPSYWYFRGNQGTEMIHKSVFQRKRIEEKLGPILEGEGEYEAMVRFGYDRIWDCGLDRWVWRPRP